MLQHEYQVVPVVGTPWVQLQRLWGPYCSNAVVRVGGSKLC